MQKFKNIENKHSNIQEIGSEGNFSALYVIIELSPPPHCMCPIHPIPPNIQRLPSPSSVLFYPPPCWYWVHDNDGCRSIAFL